MQQPKVIKVLDANAYVRSRMSTAEQLAGLAEEATELAHAALKLRRAYDGSNPTPKTKGEAIDNLLEEIGDVFLCLEVLGFVVDPEVYRIDMNEKLKRWALRLKESEK